jgi:carbon-monoxide dehydrogenase small subunit
MKKRAITLTINGEEYSLNVPVHHTLLQVIRDHLNLTDVKYGCGRGECGACTVLLDIGKGKRKPILACIALAATMDGKSITTAAGLASADGKLHPVQQAIVDESALQCGFCIPGVALKAVSILEKNPKPTEEEIRFGLEGNICRCTGYVKIVKAVQVASKKMAAGKR